MRYQYGMAVGHTYMRRMKAAKVPTLPVDFEHYLATPLEANEQGEDGHYVYPDSDSGEEASEGDD